MPGPSLRRNTAQLIFVFLLDFSVSSQNLCAVIVYPVRARRSVILKQIFSDKIRLSKLAKTNAEVPVLTARQIRIKSSDLLKQFLSDKKLRCGTDAILHEQIFKNISSFLG